MSKPITISQFAGMNNVARQPGVRCILNMDTTTDQRLVERDGYTLWGNLAGCHSLFSDGVALFAAATGGNAYESLYRILQDGSAAEIARIIGRGNPLWFVAFPDKIFISGREWNGIYERATDSVRPWGETYGDDPAALVESDSEQRMTLAVTGAPLMENLCLSGARIFGSVGSRLHYNDPPYAYEMFRPDSFHDLGGGDITMVAQTLQGLYVASLQQTWFAAGQDPEEFIWDVVGDGALPGSLAYIEQYKGQSNVPVWISKTGLQVGVQGQSIPLSREKVRFDAAGRAAGLCRMKDGVLQYLAAMPLPADVGFGDQATAEVFRKGVLV